MHTCEQGVVVRDVTKFPSPCYLEGLPYRDHGSDLETALYERGLGRNDSYLIFLW